MNVTDIIYDREGIESLVDECLGTKAYLAGALNRELTGHRMYRACDEYMTIAFRDTKNMSVNI